MLEVLPTQLPKGLLKEFLEYAEDSLVPAPPSNEYDSKFEEDVAIKLADNDIRIIPQFKAAGYFIDLVARKNDYHNNCYFSLASGLDLKYYYFLSDVENDDFYHNDYFININEFEEFLKNFL